MIVYVSIGNSDDKLTQQEWSEFVSAVEDMLYDAPDLPVMRRHGAWVSRSDAPWQNACWCVEFAAEADALAVRRELRRCAADYRQDSIAWAVAETEFLTPNPS